MIAPTIQIARQTSVTNQILFGYVERQSLHQVQSHLEIVSLENLKIILKHANIAMKRQALGQTGVPSKDKFVGKMKLVHVMIALTNQEYFTTSKKKSLGPAQLAIQMVPGNITALTTHTAPNQEMENAIPSKAL